MCQICVSPVALLCQMISDFLSPFISPVPTMLHGNPTKAALPFSPSTVARPLTRSPFMCQICVSPVELLCQSKSVFPSPLKSFVPTMLQGGPMKAALPVSPSTVARPILEEPLINQICDSPVEALCHRMSPRPSPLKSLLTINGVGGTNPPR